VVVLYVLSALTAYCDALSLQFDNRFSDVIASYIDTMVTVFKAYTVTLKDFTIFYTFNDNLFFSFFDKAVAKSPVTYSDEFAINDNIEQNLGTMRAKSSMIFEDVPKFAATTHKVSDNMAIYDQGNVFAKKKLKDRFIIEDTIKTNNGSKKIPDKLMFSDSFTITVIGDTAPLA